MKLITNEREETTFDLVVQEPMPGSTSSPFSVRTHFEFAPSQAGWRKCLRSDLERRPAQPGTKLYVSVIA